MAYCNGWQGIKKQNYKTPQKECWINFKSLGLSVVQADCFSESVLLLQASTVSYLKFKITKKTYVFL